MRFFSPLIAALTLTSPALAQDAEIANGSRIGNWLVGCEAVSVSQTACRVQQTLSVAETGQIVVNMMAAPRGDDAAVLVAQVPMGVFFPGGAVFRAQGDDAGPQTEMVWQRCGGQVCEAAIDLSADALADLAADGTILFGYRMGPSSDPIVVALEVADLADAVNAIRPAP